MNVFIIESPLQLLNSLEAKYYYKLESAECDLLVLNGDNPNSVKQIVKMVNRSDWNSIKIIGFGNGKISWITRMIKLKKEYKTYKDPDLVFIGDYRSDLMRDFVNKVNPRQTVLIDDGTVSLRIHRVLTSENERRKFLNGDSKDRLKKLIKSMVYLGNVPIQKHVDNLVLFTVYDLPSSENLLVTKNNYLYMKSISSEREKLQEVWLLGSPLVEKGILESAEVYIDCLSKIKKHYSEVKKIVYVPHRAENEEWIKVYDKLGFEILRPDASIELYLMIKKEIPNVVASFYSSALGNIYNIFGEQIQIDSFIIPKEQLPEKSKAEIINIYDYYSRLVNTIPL
ncbi:glycosyltransferase family 52 [Radiobacillus kanasensis]|uniref:glycosyltransferase family 52 n=1 Tax=Radiobacillus kanasensis TaxID=2844358 RepID=UPI001E497065|nr:glycosyltransferase family 52 [Radiobacillus kanasensis]UFT98883.1 glycosyltransferase family 52 [Radiobacillus kanasensis]